MSRYLEIFEEAGSPGVTLGLASEIAERVREEFGISLSVGDVGEHFANGSMVPRITTLGLYQDAPVLITEQEIDDCLSEVLTEWIEHNTMDHVSIRYETSGVANVLTQEAYENLQRIYRGQQNDIARDVFQQAFDVGAGFSDDMPICSGGRIAEKDSKELSEIVSKYNDDLNLDI